MGLPPLKVNIIDSITGSPNRTVCLPDPRDEFCRTYNHSCAGEDYAAPVGDGEFVLDEDEKVVMNGVDLPSVDEGGMPAHPVWLPLLEVNVYEEGTRDLVAVHVFADPRKYWCDQFNRMFEGKRYAEPASPTGKPAKEPANGIR